MNILIVDDDPEIAWSLGNALKQAGHQVQLAADAEQAQSRILELNYQLVVTDIQLPGSDGLTLFRHVRARAPDTAVILITAFAAVEDAVAALKQGAYDYLTKPFDLAELVLKAARIEAHLQLQARLQTAEHQLSSRARGGRIIGTSPAMVRVLEHIEMFAATDFPVLITGESGTGKELVAQRIHQRSPRGAGPFVAVNCAALPESLIEAELFGHVKGAFTGADRAREGRFRAAHTGTLFLDEIGDMPLQAQVRLLRVLQDSVVQPVGSSTGVSVDVRILAATHQDLNERIAAGRFRQDLYFRIQVLQLEVPPLRQRGDDLLLLVRHFLARHAGEHAPAQLSAQAWAALAAHPYPGNVRELEHAIAHAGVMARAGTIDLQHLPNAISGISLETAAPPRDGFQKLGAAMQNFERQHIVRALERSAGKKQVAADLLGISRKSLWLKMRKYGIGPGQSRLAGTPA